MASWEAKWGEGGTGAAARPGAEFAGTKSVFPTDVPDELRERMQQVAVEAFNALRLRDYGRVDLRVTPTEEIYVIEVNPNCYLERTAEFSRAAAEAGIAHARWSRRILELAQARYYARDRNERSRRQGAGFSVMRERRSYFLRLLRGLLLGAALLGSLLAPAFFAPAFLAPPFLAAFFLAAFFAAFFFAAMGISSEGGETPDRTPGGSYEPAVGHRSAFPPRHDLMARLATTCGACRQAVPTGSGSELVITERGEPKDFRGGGNARGGRRDRARGWRCGWHR